MCKPSLKLLPLQKSTCIELQKGKIILKHLHVKISNYVKIAKWARPNRHRVD